MFWVWIRTNGSKHQKHSRPVNKRREVLDRVPAMISIWTEDAIAYSNKRHPNFEYGRGLKGKSRVPSSVLEEFLPDVRVGSSTRNSCSIAPSKMGLR
jgi:hypothetical protein